MADLITLKPPFKLHDEGHYASSPSKVDLDLEEGLHHIIGSSLGVRLCGSQNDAIAMLHQVEKRSHNLGKSNLTSKASRIWPLDTMTGCCSRSKAYSELLSPHRTSQGCGLGGWNAVDPVECFSIAPSCSASGVSNDQVMKALYKACRNWILTRDDKAASAIMEKIVFSQNEKSCESSVSSIGCITTNGNRHTLGSMTISNHTRGSARNFSVSQRPVAFLKQYHSLNDQIKRLEDECHNVNHVMTVSKEIHLILVQLVGSQRHLKELTSKLSQVQAKRKSILHELAMKKDERKNLSSIIKEISKQDKDVEKVLNELGRHSNSITAQDTQSCHSILASYNNKQLQMERSKAQCLEDTLQDALANQSTMSTKYDDSQIALQELKLRQEEIENIIENLTAGISNTVDIMMNVKKEVQQLDVPAIETAIRESQCMTIQLQDLLNSVAEKISNSDEAIKVIISKLMDLGREYITHQDCVCDSKEQHSMSDSGGCVPPFHENADDTDAVIGFIESPSFLLTVKCAILRKVCEVCAKGEEITSVLEKNSVKFIENMMVELEELASSRSKLDTLLRALWCDLESMQLYDDQYIDKVKNALHKNLKVKKAMQIKLSTSRQGVVTRSDFDKHIDDVIYNMHMDMEQRQITLDNLQSKWQLVSMYNNCFD